MKKNTLFIVFIIVIALAIGIWRDNQEPSSATESAKEFIRKLPLTAGTALPVPQKLPAIELIDMHNAPFTNDRFKNRWSFLFFGYTQCPNICPSILRDLSQIEERLHAGNQVQFILISINPEQDTPYHLKDYFEKKKFKKASFIGVTGDKESIHDLAKSIGLHISEEPQEKEPIQHAGTILLINPQGELAAFFTSSQKPYAIVHDFKEIVHYYAKAA